MIARKIVNQLRQPGHTYALTVTLIGGFLFAIAQFQSFHQYSLSDWVMIYAMVGAVLILEYYTFQLPPEGHRQSMDSSVYLAAVFVFGGSFALFVLSISTVILLLHNRSIRWWKHLLNFAIYTLMILGSSYAYSCLGGVTGPIEVRYLPEYALALFVYFVVNVILVGVYYYLLYKGKLYEIIRTFLSDVVFAYLSTLLLSVVLAILIVSHRAFGLFIFLAIGMLLSHVFRQLFKMYNEISEKANTDQRTGLYSHSFFEEKLDDYMKQAKEKGMPLSLVMLDLDDFKKYNDAFGHPQGDKLLGFFGQLVKAECEPNSLFAARYGGEEFAIIMPGFTKDAAKAFVDGFRKKVNDTPFEGAEVFPHRCISFSAGVLEVNKETYDKSHLIDWADSALYAAKAKGKNTVFVYGEEARMPRRLEDDITELDRLLTIFLSKDVYTFKHSKRVFSYAADMAEVLNLSEEDRRLLVLGALIHDIGKLEIPRDILNKEGELTAEEWEIVKKHVLWGKEIVSVTPKFRELVPLVELHHERFDGKGYPYGYKGKEIPRLARMLCIIDSFDAMTTERPYQKTKSYEEALEEIRLCAGTQFDPELADAFLQYMAGRLNSGLHDAAAAKEPEDSK